MSSHHGGPPPGRMVGQPPHDNSMVDNNRPPPGGPNAQYGRPPPHGYPPNGPGYPSNMSQGGPPPNYYNGPPQGNGGRGGPPPPDGYHNQQKRGTPRGPPGMYDQRGGPPGVYPPQQGSIPPGAHPRGYALGASPRHSQGYIGQPPNGGRPGMSPRPPHGYPQGGPPPRGNGGPPPGYDNRGHPQGGGRGPPPGGPGGPPPGGPQGRHPQQVGPPGGQQRGHPQQQVPQNARPPPAGRGSPATMRNQPPPNHPSGRGPPPGPPGGQPGSQQGLPWQNPEADYQCRRQMIAQIVRLLQARKPNAPPEWLQKLPDMAKRLEDKLYRYAQTKEEYMNRNSLKERLQYIAWRLSTKRNNAVAGGGPRGPPSSGGGPSDGSKPGAPPGQQPPPSMGSNPYYNQHQQQQRPPSHQDRKDNSSQQQQPPGMNRGMPSNNPNGSNYPQQMQQQGGRGPPPSGALNPPQNGNNGGNNSNGRNDSQRPDQQTVLRQQQQRLLLLRHARTCPEKGVCRWTPLCKQMKELWRHIAKCKDNQCRYPHCVSSRYVLSHYHRCRDQQCQVCGPVWRAINQQQQQQANNGGRGPPLNSHPGRGHPNMPAGPPGGPRGYPSSVQGQPPPQQQPPGGAPHPNNVYPRQTPVGAPPPPGQGQIPRGMPSQPHSSSMTEEQQKIFDEQKREMEKMKRELALLRSQKEQQAAPPPSDKPLDVPPTKITLSRSTSKKAKEPKKNLKSQKSSGGRGKGKNAKQAPQKVAPTTAAYGNTPQTANINGYPNTNGATHPIGNKPYNASTQQSQEMMKMQQSRLREEKLREQKKQIGKKLALERQHALTSGISMINTMNRDDIKKHIASLVQFSSHIKPSDIKAKIMPLLKQQTDQQFAYIFLKPVDPVQFEIPDYFDVIKHPMDLTTVKRRIEQGYYRDLKSFAKDILLIYDNAILYNPEGGPEEYGVHETAREYAQLFIVQYNKLLEELKEQEAIKRANKDACRLCGGRQYTFEPPVYYCNGRCSSKIKRSAYYYATSDNKMFWCVNCYQQLGDSVTMEDGTTTPKSSLEKKKNTELTEESWVQCNLCNRWYHQICVMFNSRNEESKNSQYFCPMCILRYLDKNKIDKIQSNSQKTGFLARTLARCKFSDYIEGFIKQRVLKERKLEAENRGIKLRDVPVPGRLTVRVVLHKDTEVFPRGNLERLYKDAPFNYPKSFPHKVKCVLLFQNVDGVDILFFALYIQSYGSDCPAPNKRTMYIAYLDSVFYMQPRTMRTPIYHELLTAVLQYEKNRGITKAFIWACPPLAGDDYILYCHPKEQKTQKAEMLRNWYIRLLDDCRKKGIVISVDNLYDRYIRRVCNPCGIPNFDGDYWPGVTEQFIEDLERDKIDPKGLAPRAKRAVNRSKNAGKNKGTGKKGKSKGWGNKKSKKKRTKAKYSARAANRKKNAGANGDENGEDDEEENLEELALIPPAPAKFVELAQSDALTAKIGEVIKQMKEDFFVVNMHHICAECTKDLDEPNELFWLPHLYKPGAGHFDMIKNKYAPPYALCDKCYREAYLEEFGTPVIVPEDKIPLTIEEKKKQDNVKSEIDVKNENSSSLKRKASVSVENTDTVTGKPSTKKNKSEKINENGANSIVKTEPSGIDKTIKSDPIKSEDTIITSTNTIDKTDTSKGSTTNIDNGLKETNNEKTGTTESTNIENKMNVNTTEEESKNNGNNVNPKMVDEKVQQNNIDNAKKDEDVKIDSSSPSNPLVNNNNSQQEKNEQKDKKEIETKQNEASDTKIDAKGEDTKALVEDTKVDDTKVDDTKVDDTKVDDTKVDNTKVGDSKVDDTKNDDTKMLEPNEKKEKDFDKNVTDNSNNSKKVEEENNIKVGEKNTSKNEDVKVEVKSENTTDEAIASKSAENGQVNTYNDDKNMIDEESEPRRTGRVRKSLTKEDGSDDEDEGMDGDIPPPPPQGARVLETDERVLEAGEEAKPQNPWIIRPCKLEEMIYTRSYTEIETKDPDPLQDNQFFDTRQQFLSLCQGNRYQFDQLRRTKHSSMMILYHLHNPDEPGFVHSCNHCATEIKDESWWKCKTCEDYDLCSKCKENGTHKHPADHVLEKCEHESNKKKKAAEGSRNVQLQQHMELLVHASGCNRQNCSNPDCDKMKKLLRHGSQCQAKVQGGCKFCRKIWLLLQFHARQCRLPQGRCMVPRCGDIKNHFRKQQAASTDRRIRAQTQRMREERESAQVPTVAQGGPGGPQQPGHQIPSVKSDYQSGPGGYPHQSGQRSGAAPGKPSVPQRRLSSGQGKQFQ